MPACVYRNGSAVAADWRELVLVVRLLLPGAVLVAMVSVPAGAGVVVEAVTIAVVSKVFPSLLLLLA